MMDLDAKKAVIRRIKKNLTFTEVFCTRIVKESGGGSVLVGLTATLPADATMDDAHVATLVLGAEVDQLAYDRCLAGRGCSARQHDVATTVIKSNYTKMISEALDKQAKRAEKLNGSQARADA
jgi:hypothetical protein